MQHRVKVSQVVGSFLVLVLLISNLYLHMTVFVLIDDINELHLQIQNLKKNNEEWMFEAIVDGDKEKFNILLPKVDINYSNEQGVTFLHSAVANDNIMMVKRLLENGANVNIANISGVTTFHLAVYNKNEEMLKTITAPKNQPNINQVDNTGRTPLEVAKAKGYLELIEILKTVK
ncbi:ankyrin repeat domain-containing protein [Pseudoalteromonas sp. T1lg22]|uniref:ankyrin repeat domain-containing protein n=1 Tax=Pseudoalteromonas sp. T1lg22 TaxID=2077096 RepID=UPI000CF6DF30|nr:ankyrin repeat domain-containing protein [Pseudoalteromonas sp. T1lg22]